MSEVTFLVPVKPVSTNATYRRGRGSGFYKTAEAVAFANAVKLCARKAMSTANQAPFTGPVHVTLAFTFPNAASDIDGPVKSVLDALQGVVYPNDKRVVTMAVSKVVGDPGSVRVTVREAQERAA